MATNEDVVKEVIKSRQLNHTEHEVILEAAKVSMELSKDINEIKQNWIGFKKTLVFGRSIALTFAVIWILFGDTLKSFGG